MGPLALTTRWEPNILRCEDAKPPPPFWGLLSACCVCLPHVGTHTFGTRKLIFNCPRRLDQPIGILGGGERWGWYVLGIPDLNDVKQEDRSRLNKYQIIGCACIFLCNYLLNLTILLRTFICFYCEKITQNRLSGWISFSFFDGCVWEKCLLQRPWQFFLQLRHCGVKSLTKEKKKSAKIPRKEVTVRTTICHRFWLQQFVIHVETHPKLTDSSGKCQKLCKTTAKLRRGSKHTAFIKTWQLMFVHCTPMDYALWPIGLADILLVEWLAHTPCNPVVWGSKPATSLPCNKKSNN